MHHIPLVLDGRPAFVRAVIVTKTAAFHGSWNRSRRTGYKVVHIFLRNDQPTGEYEDFLTGFVINESDVWGRPVGVAVAQDGSLMVSEDGNGSIWRVSYRRQ
jgi:glucose/arabinose dehydrogenase